ncbi:MAG: RNA polymerase sigma-54 factor [Verrucomicrobiales bacterium]|jgi:RNA polymerase sigma-54 factor
MSGPGFQQQPSQSQSLSQQQKLSPQMQQSLAVLQAPTLELRKLIQQELEENPVLEDLTEDISLDEKQAEEEEFEKEFEELSQLDDDWREHMANHRAASRNDEASEKHQFVMDSLVEHETLQEHLLHQLGLSDASEEDQATAEMLIGNIDEDGFLGFNIEDYALSARLPYPQLKRCLEMIQTFHPVGVGAQDLRECLLVQLERLDKDHSLEYRIVDNHLDDLAHRRYPQIARRLGVTPHHITEAAEFIGTLDPKPGSAFTETKNSYITPDVIVSRDGGEFAIEISNEQIPHLRISNAYKDIMSQADSSTEARDYIRNKIRGGKFLIQSIAQRQDTMRKISEQIVKHQNPFFRRGSDFLKPMNMAQIAEIVEVHETTVSRAISGKYIATPHGVFEMKYFFKPGYRTDSGEDMSNTSVKNAIAELVKNENQLKPLSDEKIVTELKEKGISIARRTVAKYRDALNILPSHLRKSY